MQTLLQDLRYALRILRKNPGFTAVAVLTLALGIGANTAIFTVVNAVLLKPLPYPDPDRIVQFVWRFNDGPIVEGATIPEFVAWREQAQALEDFTMYDQEGAFSGGGTEYYFIGPGVNLTGGDRPERLTSFHVSANYFRLFGAPMEIGRAFTAQEDIPHGPRVAVISDGFWRRRFGADRNLLGKAILLGGEPYVIVGVLAPGFDIDLNSDVWLPLQMDPNSTDQYNGGRAAARLKRGVTLEMAKAQTKLAEAEFRRRFPDSVFSQASFDLETIREGVVGDIRPDLFVLLGAVALCSSLPAPTLPTCCWRAPLAAGGRWPFGRLWAPDGGASSPNCSVKVCCCPSLVGRWVCFSVTQVCAACLPSILATFPISAHKAPP